MAHVSVGDICLTGRLHRLALVIFLREPSEGRPEDVRVVPLAVAGVTPPATERDVLIPETATHFRKVLLAESWNARSLVSDALSIPIGRVSARVVDAVRTAEMVGIAPEVDVRPFADMMGQHRDSEREQEAIAAFQDAEVEAWNAIEAAYLANVPTSHGGWIYEREMYAHRKQVGRSADLARTGISVVSSIELPMATQPVQTPQWIVSDEGLSSEVLMLGAAA